MDLTRAAGLRQAVAEREVTTPIGTDLSAANSVSAVIRGCAGIYAALNREIIASMAPAMPA